MLTVDMLKQNTTLAGLSDTQISAIVEMSRNDEATVIGNRIGTLHGQYDADIFNTTGIAKNQGEKSYDYVKRVLSDYKSKIESTSTIQAQLQNAKNEVEKLKAQIADGSGDETIKQQLKDTKSQVKQLQEQLSKKEAEYLADKQRLEKEALNIRIDHAFSSATAGLKFKSGFTPAVQAIVLEAAKAEVLSKGTPDFIEGKLVFRDANGNILNNPSNNLNPYTAEELLMQTSLKDVLEKDNQQEGGGTKPPRSTSSTDITDVDLTGVKTQVEADKRIESYLLAQGITRDDSAFSEKLFAIRADNKVAELPIR